WTSARSRTQRIDSSSSATRRVPPALVCSAVMDLAHGQGHAEARAAGAGSLVYDGAPVLREDALAEGEAEAAAPRLGREERSEQPLAVGLGHARAAVAHP